MFRRSHAHDEYKNNGYRDHGKAISRPRSQIYVAIGTAQPGKVSGWFRSHQGILLQGSAYVVRLDGTAGAAAVWIGRQDKKNCDVYLLVMLMGKFKICGAKR